MEKEWRLISMSFSEKIQNSFYFHKNHFCTLHRKNDMSQCQDIDIVVRQWLENTPSMETKTYLLCCSSGVKIKTLRIYSGLNYDYALQQARKQTARSRTNLCF